MAAIFDRFKGHHVCIIIVSLVIIFFLCCFIFALSDKLFLVIGGGSVLLSIFLGSTAIWYMFQRGRIDEANIAEVRKIANSILQRTEAIPTIQDSLSQLMESGSRSRAESVPPPPGDIELRFDPEGKGMPILSVVIFYSLLRAQKTGKGLDLTELNKAMFGALPDVKKDKTGLLQSYTYIAGAVAGLRSVLPSGCIRWEGESLFVATMPKGFEEAITEAIKGAKKSRLFEHMVTQTIAAIDAYFNEP